MNNAPVLLEEETLDPADWSTMKELGHRMLDDMFEYLQTLRLRPAWNAPTAFAVNSMQQPLPQSSQDPSDVYEDFFTQVLPFNKGNVHPRFWSWVEGGGTPLGMLADMLAAGMNANLAIGNHMPMYVEKQVLEWSRQMMGFPEGSSGILVSGGSVANITSLQVARNHFNKDIRSKGLRAMPANMMVYASSETHNCMNKAVEVAGLGSDNYRRIPVDHQYRIKLDELTAMISADKEAGHIPFCIVGNAGTVNTGAIDPLAELAAIAKKEGMWFHIDGAFGAVPKILPEFEEQLKAIEQADSLAFDFHKWFYVNYEVGCVLVRDATIHRDAFATPANYLAGHQRGLSAGPDPFSNYGMELSRGFKALKVWMSLKEHGIEKYRRLIRQNLQQANYLAKLVMQEHKTELVADVPLNIVCFRFNPGNLSDNELNIINKEILMRLQEEGIAAPSYTILNGKYVIRAAITNHRSKMEDFEVLIKETVRIGNELVS